MKVKFADLFIDNTKLGKKIQKNDYLPYGKYPIIDQGQEYIAGYTNNKEGLYENVPSIVFGDHTRIVKYVDIPFFLGADGVKVLNSNEQEVNYKYLYYAVSNVKIPNTGYNRHFKWLKESTFYLPNIKTQNEICSVLDKLEAIISNKRSQLKKFDELIKSRFYIWICKCIQVIGVIIYE